MQPSLALFSWRRLRGREICNGYAMQFSVLYPAHEDTDDSFTRSYRLEKSAVIIPKVQTKTRDSALIEGNVLICVNCNHGIGRDVQRVNVFLTVKVHLIYKMTDPSNCWSLTAQHVYHFEKSAYPVVFVFCFAKPSL